MENLLWRKEEFHFLFFLLFLLSLFLLFQFFYFSFFISFSYCQFLLLFIFLLFLFLFLEFLLLALSCRWCLMLTSILLFLSFLSFSHHIDVELCWKCFVWNSSNSWQWRENWSERKQPALLKKHTHTHNYILCVYESVVIVVVFFICIRFSGFLLAIWHEEDNVWEDWRRRLTTLTFFHVYS